MSIFMTFVLMLGSSYNVGASSSFGEQFLQSGKKEFGANILDEQGGIAYEITITDDTSSVGQESHSEATMPMANPALTESPISLNALTRPMKYYGVDRGSPYTDANYATLAQHAVKTIIVDTFINDANNSTSAKWSHIKTLAAQYNFNYVIWPNQGGDVPGCGWETPFNSPQNGDYIWRVTTMLDSFTTDPHFIGMISAHEPMWNTSTCKTSISDMTSIKTQLKNYMQTKGRTDFKVWNYIDNVSDLKNMPGFVSADIERVMDVAVTWQHCFGGAEGTCTGAKNKIIADRALIDNAGLNGKVDLVYLFQTFATGGGYSMPTLTDMQTWDCQFIATNALDGFMYYTWGAWYSTDLSDHPELWPEMNRVYDSCVNQAPDTSAPAVLSSVRDNVNPTSAISVDFIVTFSESVTGVTADDFFSTTSGVSGAAVSGLSGSGSVYTVTVNTGTGNGTIRLDVVDNNSIVDTASNPLGGADVGDGNFTGGEIYTITKPIAPTSKWTGDFSYAQGWRTDLHPRTNGDVNGDGKDDLVGFGYGGIFVSLSNGTQFLSISKWSGDYSYDQGWRIELHPRMVGDVNGDGKDDVVGYGSGGAWVALSDGSQFLPVSSWTTDFSYVQGWRTDLHPRAVGDMNGDGKDDLIGFGYGGIFVALSDGTKFLPVAKWSGDYSYDQGWRIELHPRMVGDVNGDGKDDVVGYGSGGVWVALSDGSKFLTVTKWTDDFSYAQGWRTDLHPRVVGDMNGDGKDDLIGFGYGGVFVSLSDGAKFLPVSKWSGDYSYDQGWRIELHPRMVGDVNGDLKEDVVGYGTGGAWISVGQ